MLDSAVRVIFTVQSKIRNRKFGGLVRSGPVRGFFKDLLTAASQTCRKFLSLLRRISLAKFSVPIRIAAIDVQFSLWLHVLPVLKSDRFEGRGSIRLSSAFGVSPHLSFSELKEKVMRKALFGILALALMSSAARANYTYALDTGVNSGNIEWDADRYTASLQVFPTNELNTVIDQLKVAWGNQTGDAHVILYSLDNGYQLPHTMPVDTSKLHVLQSLDTTVTSLQTNAFTGTQTNPTWMTYSIAPTTITTNYFAVGTIQRVLDPYNYAPNTMDMSVDLAHDGSNGYSWFATNYGSLTDDLSNACTNNNGGDNDEAWVQKYSGYGYGNNPFLLNAVAEAAPVPEPMTMASVFMALGGLGAWVRRRVAKPQA